jgi:hypothetical protein
VAEVHYGGSYISIYLCPNHPNERWDVSTIPPYCIPCELIKLRAQLDSTRIELHESLQTITKMQDEIDALLDKKE